MNRVLILRMIGTCTSVQLMPALVMSHDCTIASLYYITKARNLSISIAADVVSILLFHSI